MKKTLVALAALAATSAFAQSSVTISGNVDLGYQSIKDTASADGWNAARKNVTPAGNGAAGWTSSALGLDVTEDLGNGTKAGYSAAMDLNSISGTDAGGQLLGNARHSFLQLSGAAGQVRYGYMYTLDDQIQGGVGRNTPTGNTRGRFQNAEFDLDPGTGAAGAAGRRFGNGLYTIRTTAAEYSTPTMGGFTGIVQFGKIDQKKTEIDTVDNAVQKNDWQAVGAKYSNGPLNLGLSTATEKSKADTTTGTVGDDVNVKRKHNTFAANYDFQVVKAFFNYTQRKFTGNTGAVPADQFKVKGYDFGLSAPMGKTTLFASMGNGSWKNNDGTTGVEDTNLKIKAYNLGATYELSKRTSLNAYYSNTKGTSKIEADDGFQVKKRIIGAGLRHSF